MTTPRLNFVEWLTGTTEPEVLHNTLALKVDVFLAGGVKSRTTSVEPTSPAPSEGDCYIIPASSPAASGAAWSSFTPNYVAAYYDGAWVQYAPPGRFLTYVDDEQKAIVWDGTAYLDVTSPITNKFDATTAPTAADDSSAGYAAGSLWVDVSNDAAYICVDATASSPASAIWQQISAASVVNNYAASTAPTAADDSGAGYSVGSVWIDTTNDAAYICVDATASSPVAAVWKQISPERVNNYIATTDPTAANDAGEGYGAGSLWINTSTPSAWLCLDATAASPQAANWLRLGGDLVLTPAPSADHTASGVVASMTVGEAVVFGEALFIHTDGKLYKAESGTVAERVVAMALATGATNDSIDVLLFGFVRDDTWAWTVGSPVYNSATAGGLTQTAPATTGHRVQVMGYATHADRMIFNPSVDWVELA